MLQDLIRETIEHAITAAQTAAQLPAFEMPAVEIMRPKQAEHGDYSTNVAMVVASAIRKTTGQKSNPRQIAQAIVDHIPADNLLDNVDLAGPGFINLRLADSWLQVQVNAMIEAGDSFGNLTVGQGKRWQVEYVSANPTGPIHYGGARNAVLGDGLANVLEAAGYEIQREFYVNDAGNQFGLFAESLYARYAQRLGQDAPFPEEGYQGEYMFDYAQTVIDEHGEHFMSQSKEAVIEQFKVMGRAIVLEALKEELAQIGVEFDRWYSEQSLYDENLTEAVLNQLDEKGDLGRYDGATWFLSKNYNENLKNEVVIRSDGRPTYFASDIAYHYDKFKRRQFDRVINVWSVDHQGHIPRMGTVMQALALDPARLTILLYNLVKLMRDGKEAKLSKRKGNLVTINDVVSEVGADALRFNLLTRGPQSPIEFDLDLAIAEDNENPVYYVQYGHARICSILNRPEAQGFEESDEEINLSLLAHPSELALIRKLLELEEQILVSAEQLSPHNLTHYSIDLTKTFSGFYRDCKVLDDQQPALSRARLALCRATRVVLAKVLRLIGVNAPESM